MCTSSMNNTPGAISAFPSSLHSETKIMKMKLVDIIPCVSFCYMEVNYYQIHTVILPFELI